MAFKQRSCGPFKMMGSSPVKKNGIWKGTKKILSKFAVPVMAAINAPKLLEKDGIRKFAGSMIWDEDLFRTSIHHKLNPPKITKYNPNEEIAGDKKGKIVKGLYDRKSLR